MMVGRGLFELEFDLILWFLDGEINEVDIVFDI